MTIHMIIHVRFFYISALKVSCSHLVSSDITEIILKVALNTIISTPCEFRLPIKTNWKMCILVVCALNLLL